MRYFLHIGFNGFQYHGWQRQPNALGVQSVLEAALEQVLKEPIEVVGCGRTDAQVHASQFFCHFDSDQVWEYDLVFRLNKTLPPDIAIFDLIPLEGTPHARYGAYLRTYDYFIHRYKDPFLSMSSACYPDLDLDLRQMQAAVAILPKYDDYYAFCKSPASFSNTLCRVSDAHLYVNARGDKIRFQISSNRFLTGMIRIIVYQLLEVGKGVITVDQFEHYLKEKQTPKAIIPAYPQGLYLSKVTYPFLDLAPRTDLLRCYKQTMRAIGGRFRRLLDRV